MKYLRPTREDLFFKSVKRKRMIDPNSEWFNLFINWIGDRYEKVNTGWINKYAHENKGRIYTVPELKEMYENLTGTKAPKFEPSKPS